MRKNRVHCFIAIKFGENDTDAIYEKIEGLVSELGLLPRRIDRIEHIENINNNIIDELDNADIAIADLTYERPSVYYEAGYAQRKIPVIYTCREDHSPNKDNNFRVHFDVDRYNIIFWNDPSDETFQPKLKSRLQSVINELVNIPLVNNLNDYKVYLNRSRLNPDNVFNRITNLFSQLKVYPKVERSHLNHERNIHERTALYKEIFEMIQTDFSIEAAHAQQSQWTNLIQIIEDELHYLEKLYEEANYGNKVMYASYLSELYKAYLESVTKVYQRPSNKYQSRYDKVKLAVEKLIRDIEQPVWS